MKYHETTGYSFLLDENHFVYRYQEFDSELHIFIKSKPHSAGFAVHDVINCFLLCCRQFMGFPIVRIKAVKHILYRAVFAHDPPPSKTSKGLRIPSSVLLLTCRYTSVERGSTWPRSDWMYLISTPLSNK